MFNNADLLPFMTDAYNEALHSPDPSSQNGAVVIKSLGLDLCHYISNGHNHFYNGIEPEVEDRDEKLRRIEHAERDAIYRAASYGDSTQGAILVCPWVACCDCARAIIGSGFTMVLHHWDRYLLTPPRWSGQVNQALGWMEAAGIRIQTLEGPIPSTEPILVSGRLWSPALCEYVTSGQDETELQRTG